MVKYTTKPAEGTSEMDESWWAALLAEEEKHGVSASMRAAPEGNATTRQTIPHPVQKPGMIDWERAHRLYERDETVNLEVTGYNRGGLLVNGESLQGFVPVSHLVGTTGANANAEQELLASYVGTILSLKVIECDSSRGRIVFSERAAQAGEGRRNQLLNQLVPGDCVDGVVTNITDFGIFIDLGGIEGLVHVSEISWGRVRHPMDAAEVGERVRAYVIQVDKERSRIALSLKRLCENPWDTAELRYYPGQTVEAVITSLAPFGAFARLEEGLDGLIHLSEMEVPDETGRLVSQLSEGQHIKARVLHVDAARQRLGLSLKLNGEE